MNLESYDRVDHAECCPPHYSAVCYIHKLPPTHEMHRLDRCDFKRVAETSMCDTRKTPAETCTCASRRFVKSTPPPPSSRCDADDCTLCLLASLADTAC